MEIVVNDTNILIDLYNAGLLGCCKQLNLDFRTLDLIMEEMIELNICVLCCKLVSFCRTRSTLLLAPLTYFFF